MKHAATTPQLIIMRVIHQRAPTLCIIRLDGTSNTAYPMKNKVAPKAYAAVEIP